MQNRTLRIFFSSLAAAAMAVALSGVAAGAGAARGSETKGRTYFRKTCKDCHVKGAKGGEISPLTKTQAQWRTYLQKGKHANGTEALSKFLDEQQMLDVQTFLINHAADSPQPETCGK